MKKLSINLLIDKKAHLGHKMKSLNFKIYNYISCIVNNISIIDIERSLIHIKKSANLINDISTLSTYFLFISKKIYSGTLSNIKYITEKYNPGYFTNNAHNIDILIITHEERKNMIAGEASTMSIPIISVVDTNNNIEYIDYAIISNNDSNNIINMYNIFFIDSIHTAIRNNKLSFKYKYIIND